MRSQRMAALAVLMLPAVSAAAQLSDIITQFGLTDSHTFKFPTQDLSGSDAANYIISNWDLNGDHIAWGTKYISFAPDPATSSNSSARRRRDDEPTPAARYAATSGPALEGRSKKNSTSTSASATSSVAAAASSAVTDDSAVLRVEYPAGSYSNQTGGTQFYAQPINASSSSTSPLNVTSNGQYERMLLSYDVFFPSGFGFNLGGKLPGLRGGPDPTGCSGGHQADGTKCFSTRLMWRSGSLGEVYAYLPTGPKNFCSQQYITCNSDYGTSIGRGSISFATGKWQTVWLYVELNKVGTNNGIISLWYNGVQAWQLTNLEIRSAASIASVGGLYFSTFFGGDDETWASPTDQFTYFRNITIVGGLGQSDLAGSKSAAVSTVAPPRTGVIAIAAATLITLAASFVY